MLNGFSFFTISSYSTWLVRGTQMCEYLGGKLNPTSGYENDVCIFVKCLPDKYSEPQNSWFDIVDPRQKFVDKLERITKGNLIAISIPQFERLQTLFPERKTVFIPEHHCNFERETIPTRPVRTVGSIGQLHNAVQYPHEKLASQLQAMGLNWSFTSYYKKRHHVTGFYRDIDIQIVFRHYFDPKYGREEDRNPLKLENAGSFGIPTVAYPEKSYIAEWENECLWGLTMDEILAHVKRLKDDPGFYREMSARALEKAEHYHISCIAERYNTLLSEDLVENDIRFRITGYLLDKTVIIDGKSEHVYGLASLGVRPGRSGIGTEMLRIFANIAKQNKKWGIVAFTDEKTWPFYQQAGWSRHFVQKLPNKPDRVIMTSRPCKRIEVSERW